MTTQLLSTLFKLYKEKSLYGRYITYEHVHPIFSSYRSIKNETLGYSVNGNPIDCLSCGNGPVKVLMWSQMHGNESTTTKAIIDIFNTLVAESLECNHILEKLTIICVPILNPDGAVNYLRNNANDIDLNRDAINLSQPESVILRQLFDKVQP
ncbi:MAG: DUF2817 domain-containing protein, partial [Bacteroidia bacterium]|nr:DUF2817 domain-containing protein [Bacteroidia bacterium]